MDYGELAYRFIGIAVEFAAQREKRMLGNFVSGETAALTYLYWHGEAKPGEICRAAGITTARTATLLKGLEQKKFITRSRNETDGRSVLARITPEGKAHVKAHLDRVHKEIREQFALLGERDAADLIRILERLVRNLKHCPCRCAEGAK